MSLISSLGGSGGSTSDDNDDDDGRVGSTTGGIIRRDISVPTDDDEDDSTTLSSDRKLRNAAEEEDERQAARRADMDLFNRAEELDPVDDPEDDQAKADDSDDGGVKETVADATGVTDWVESESGQEIMQEANEADSRWEGFDTAVKAGTDFVLDNPNASLQDTTRERLASAGGFEDDEKLAEWAQEQDEAITETTDESVEGTAFDNPVTDAARTGSDIVFGEFGRTVIGAGTGIDTETGGTEAQTGALELGDIALTAATAGTGRAAAGGARAASKSDEAASVIGRLTGRGDEAAETAVTQGDDLLPVVRSGDDAAPGASRWVDDAAETAARSADERGRFGTDTFGRLTRGGESVGSGGSVRGVVGAVEDGARTLGGRTRRLLSRSGDDAAGAAARSGDDAAGAAARAGDDGGGAISRLTGSRAGKAAAASAGVLGGGAILESSGAFDDLSVTDEDGNRWALSSEGQFEPTEDHPEGGVLFRVDQGPAGAGKFTVMVGQTGRNVVILDADGNRVTAKIDVQEFSEAVSRGQGGGV